MRSAISIFLLALITATQTPLGQVLKLPLLIEHFVEHKKESGISLMAFLVEHYSSEHNDADRTEDEKLPFKAIVEPCVGFAIVPNSVKPELISEGEIPVQNILHDSYILQQHLSSIFHPPRV
jgi:hypothetical protein